MEHCKKCIKYDVCEFHQDMIAGEFITFFPNNEDCPFFKSTADVVEVVRCSQCKYWDNFKENYSRGNCTNEESGLFEFSLPNDYCSYGKRRDKDE